MVEIHQVMVATAPGDAVSNAAFEIRSLLRDLGPSEIYAQHIHPDLCDQVLPSHQFPVATLNEDSIIIVHLSMGDPDWLTWVASLPGRIVVSYHNISPAEYFRGWDMRTAGLLDFGRRTLGTLSERSVLGLADSSFNADELRRLGYRNVRVGGLLVDVNYLRTTTPDAQVLQSLSRHDVPTVLHVGQLFPHKRADFLLAAFRIMLDQWLPKARLVLAGTSRLPRYRECLEQFIELNDLADHVELTGAVSVNALSAYFRGADLFVTASEHEGFCVPLVEAMSFDVPIVARAFGAVPETCADAAIMLPPEATPADLAAAMAEVLTDREAADELRLSGRRRLQDFSLDNTRQGFLEALLTVA